jgi:cytochrome c oxidase subunit 2
MPIGAHMQSTVLTTAFVLMAVVAAIFLWVLKQADAGDAREKAPMVEGYRFKLFLGILFLGALVSIGSLRPWPKAVAAGSDVIDVKATGSQWSWELVPKTVPVGKPVTFSVATTDVTHGFSVYDPDGHLLFQTQAMPGYINQVSYTFKTPGKYKIFCMEYCGLAHHDMTDELVVAAQ